MELLKPDNSFVSFSTWKFGRLYCIFSYAISIDLISGKVHHEFILPGLPPMDMPNFFSLKPRGEFYLWAKAYPPSPPAKGVRVAVDVGAVRKELMVFGDRFWVRKAGLFTISDPEPFSEMEISWHRAFGGQDFPPNPIGKGAGPVAHPSGKEVWPLPNLEDPKRPIASPKDQVTPVSFCPYGPSWPQRKKKTGTFDDRWLKTRWPWFPEDFDPAYFNAAPEDQQIIGFFKGDEPINFENMHPECPVIETRLPGLKAKGFITRKDRDELLFQEIRMNLDTIWLVPHEETGLLIWHGAAETEDEDASDITCFMAVVEPLQEGEHPLEYYRALLSERLAAKEAKEIEEESTEEARAEDKKGTLAVGTPAEKAKPPTDAIASGAGSSRNQQEEIAKMEEELAKAEEELRKRLKEIGIDPETFFVSSGSETPEEDITSDTLERLKKEAKEAEANLKRTLTKMGISPDVFFRSPPYPSEPTPTAKELIGALKDAGIDDPELERQLLEMEQEAKVAEALGGEDEIGETKDNTSSEKDSEGLVWTRQKVIKMHQSGQGLAGAVLSGLDLSGLDLKGANFQGTVLDSVNFKGSVLDGADFSRASAQGARFNQCILRSARFEEAICEGADFSDADLDSATMSRAALSDAILQGANLAKTLLDDADLSGALLEGTSLRKANLSGADLVGARLKSVDLKRAVLEEADLSGSAIKDVDMSQARGSNCSFYGVSAVRVNLAGADLVGSRGDDETSMTDVDFSGADLTGGCWEGSCFDNVIFRQARLEQANFSGAKLYRADFYHATARHAIMDRATIKQCRLIAANFFQSRFEGVKLIETDLAGSNFFETEFWNILEQGCRWEFSNLKRSKLEGKA